MARYRIGNDFTLVWTINNKGEAFPLEGKNVRLYYTCERGRFEADIRIEDTNKVVWDFFGSQQKVLGGYSLTLVITQSDGKRTITKDVYDAFTLVSKDRETGEGEDDSCNEIIEIYHENVTTDLDLCRVSPIIPYVVKDENGIAYWYIDGVNTGERATGESAYEYAVSKGYEGTEDEFAQLLIENPDWSAAEGEPGYIKNKPFGLEDKINEYIFAEDEMTIDPDNDEYPYSQSTRIQLNKEFKSLQFVYQRVRIYETKEQVLDEGYYNDPLDLYSSKDSISCWLTSSIGTNSDGSKYLYIEYKSQRELSGLKVVYKTLGYKTIGEEFIPDTIARTSDLKEKIDKEEGKGLSSNDYTNEDKEKLNSLENYNDAELREAINKKVDSDKVATINGQSLINGGNIEISGGSGDSPIGYGDAENSAILRGEYEGYSNRAISQTSMAVGAGNIAGLKGWYYSKIDFTNKKITLSDKPTYTVIGTTLIGGSWNSGTPNIKAGDKISLVNNSKYDYCGEIASVSGNVITLKASLPFAELATDAGAAAAVLAGKFSDGYSIYLPDRPDAGIIDFGGGAFAEGGLESKASNICAHAEGLTTHAYGQFSHTEGKETRAGYASHAEGELSSAEGQWSHAEGYNTVAKGKMSHAEGYKTNAIGNYSHAEGFGNETDINVETALSDWNANKNFLAALNNQGHAEGNSTLAYGKQAHAEGLKTLAQGAQSHSEGYETKATGPQSHAEGSSTLAYGKQAHAEGNYSTANGDTSHAEGFYTKTNNLAEHAEGQYNVSNSGKTIHSVGIGTSDTKRKNAQEITNDGKHYILGVGGYDGTKLDGATDVATELTELSAEVSKKVDADFVNNAIAAEIDNALTEEY